MTFEVLSVPSKQTYCTYAPGMKHQGFRPNNIIPANVGHLFARSYIPSAANCSSIGRVSVSSVSGLTAFGMNLLRKISKSKSSSLAAKQGVASNVAIYEARRSNKIRSSASLAISRRGPIRINVRPLYRTGGISDGVTSTTSTSPSGVSTFSVFITGRGRKTFLGFIRVRSVSISIMARLANWPESPWHGYLS